MVWTFPRLLESLRRRRVVALKVQKLSYKVSQRLYGSIKRKLGPELKDSAVSMPNCLQSYLRIWLGRWVLFMHFGSGFWQSCLNSFITPTVFSVSIILQFYYRRVKNLLKNNSKEKKGGVSVACFHTLVNTMLIVLNYNAFHNSIVLGWILNDSWLKRSKIDICLEVYRLSEFMRVFANPCSRI